MINRAHPRLHLMATCLMTMASYRVVEYENDIVLVQAKHSALLHYISLRSGLEIKKSKYK